MSEYNHGDPVVAGIAVVFIVVVAGGFGILIMNASHDGAIDWHELGVVQSIGHDTSYSWNDGCSCYVTNNDWNATVQTQSHGLLLFDSLKGCPFGYSYCSNNHIDQLRLNETLGLKHHVGGWITYEVLP